MVAYGWFATNGDGGASNLLREASVAGCILGVVACWGLLIWWGIASSQWVQGVVAGDYRHGMDSALTITPSDNVTTNKYVHSLAAPEYRDILISDRLESPELCARSHRLDYPPMKESDTRCVHLVDELSKWSPASDI
jgi:hypothetical protein